MLVDARVGVLRKCERNTLCSFGFISVTVVVQERSGEQMSELSAGSRELLPF